jgi:hypothetical protein
MLLMEVGGMSSLEEGFLHACKIGDIEAVREVTKVNVERFYCLSRSAELLT